jgi:hypothetical protein
MTWSLVNISAMSASSRAARARLELGTQNAAYPMCPSVIALGVWDFDRDGANRCSVLCPPHSYMQEGAPHVLCLTSD